MNSVPLIFDIERFKILFELSDDSDLGFLREIADQYHDDVKAQLARLKKAVGENDFGGVAEIGHTLKGSAATLGLMQMEWGSRELEQYAKSGDAPEVQKWAAYVEEVFPESHRVLERHLGGSGSVSV